MSLSQEDCRTVEVKAELVVRRYMEHLFEVTLPRIIVAAISAHDDNVRAHGGIVKFRWLLVGFAAAGGLGTGLGLAKLLM